MKKVLFALMILVLVLSPIMAQGTQETKSDEDYKLTLKMSHVFAPKIGRAHV